MRRNALQRVLLGFWRAGEDLLTLDGFEHAGYLAFLGILALFPFLVFLVSFIGLLGQGATGAAYITHILTILPPNLTEGLKPRIVEIISGPPQGLLTVSIVGAIWTASSGFEGMRTILNRVYRVKAPPAFWLRRIFSIVEIVIFAILLGLGMLLVVAVPPLIRKATLFFHIPYLSGQEWFWSKLVYGFSLALLFLAVSGIYYLIPNIRLRYRIVIPGAVLTVGLWLASALGFAFYLSNFSQLSVVYGSLGGIIAALLFLYICNIILIFGASFNYHLALVSGRPILPDEKATSTPESVPAPETEAS